MAFLESVPAVSKVIRVDMPIMPGESHSFELVVPHGHLLSGLQMPVGSTDGLASLTRLCLMALTQLLTPATTTTVLKKIQTSCQGFDGGQPDPSRGAENVDNGNSY